MNHCSNFAGKFMVKSRFSNANNYTLSLFSLIPLLIRHILFGMRHQKHVISYRTMLEFEQEITLTLMDFT